MNAFARRLWRGIRGMAEDVTPPTTRRAQPDRPTEQSGKVLTIDGELAG